MLAPLDNETIFKKAFTDKEVFQCFIKDLFEIDVTVSKIETEKKFTPPVANIDIKLDIFAETDDHRFLIEIQRIDYDYNFNRFFNYFITVLLEQQRKASKYSSPQTVLGVVVITSPYKINQLSGEPIKESVMAIDFDPRNLNDEKIHIFNHKLVFLNPHPNYMNEKTPQRINDWLNLFRVSINEKLKIKLNLNNKGIQKTVNLIDFEKLDPITANSMKIEESKKAMLAIIENEGRLKGLEEGKQQGFEEGKQKRELEIAIEMIKENLPIDMIVRVTKLEQETVEKLINEYQK